MTTLRPLPNTRSEALARLDEIYDAFHAAEEEHTRRPDAQGPSCRMSALRDEDRRIRNVLDILRD